MRPFICSFLCTALAIGTSAATAQPVRTVTDFPDDHPLAYLGNGHLGYRVQPNPFLTWKGVASGFVTDDEGGWETQAYAPYPLGVHRAAIGAAPR